MTPPPWPDPADFVWAEPVPPPDIWDKPGLVMFFNLECPGCVSRGVPFLKRLVKDQADDLIVMMIHTAYGHRLYSRDEVAPTLTRFAGSFAQLSFPVALDLDGSLARAWGVEGTPHWLLFGPGGELTRSLYGSQDNAQTRLEYALAELDSGG